MDGAQGASTDETDYSALFEISRYGSSLESDDEDNRFLDKKRSKSSPTHVAQAGSPVHFGLAQVSQSVFVANEVISLVDSKNKDYVLNRIFFFNCRYPQHTITNTCLECVPLIHISLSHK